jgi:hypothetical protein
MDNSYSLRIEQNSAKNPSPIRPTLSREKWIEQSGGAYAQSVSGGAGASELRSMWVWGLSWEREVRYGVR